MPQAFGSVPCTHAWPSQHPGQVPGPHPVEPWQMPPPLGCAWQNPSVDWQFEHVCPNSPHAPDELPGRHTLP